MKKLRCLVGLLGLLLACAPNSTVVQPAVLPPDPAKLEAVRSERVLIDGFAEPHTPAQFNKAIYVRYSSPQVVAPRAVLVLMPGFLGGASNFERIGRWIVAQDPSVEVWAVDRRSNLLEDHAVLATAFKSHDPLMAWRHFVRDAGTATGFQPRDAASMAWMGYWGLEVHLGDLRAVILRARSVAPKVVLGGHSLGSAMAVLYAGWDFAGRAGWQDLDALLLLDGAAGRVGGSLDQQTYLDGGTGSFGVRTAGVRDLESGRATPYFEALGMGPLGLARYSAVALLAALDPQGDSPGGVVNYSASNLAAGLLGGLGGDDDYAAVGIWAVSAGHALGLVGPNLAAIALNGWDGLRIGQVLGPLPGARRVEWLAPQATENEFTDPEGFAKRFWTPEADFQEWYFPNRLSLDIGAVGLRAPDWARAKLPLTHLNGLRLPILAVGAGRGLVRGPESFAPLEQESGRRIEWRGIAGFTHLDVLSATRNPVPGWALELLGP